MGGHFQQLQMGGQYQPQAGIREHQVPVQQDQNSQVYSSDVSLDSLFNMHIKSKQYKAYDFAKIGNFPYCSQIKPNNMNLALYGYGSIKHLLALADGTLPPCEHSEYLARLQHIMNVFEMVCLGSKLNEYDTYAWRVGREYNEKIVKDIEMGYKTWTSLDRSIDPTAWTYAKEVVPSPTLKTNQQPNRGQNEKGLGPTKLCTTWNTFKQQGCHYEHHNQGETCVFQHFCSKCKLKGLFKKHKAWECNADAKAPQQQPSISSATGNSTPVTSG